MTKVGRPSVDTEAVTVRLPRHLIDVIDNVRKEKRGLPSRQEIIRRVLVGWVSSGCPGADDES